MRTLTGHCLCRACRFELVDAHNWVGHCHCESCRRATASPVTTFVGHPDEGWRWLSERLCEYDSSPGRTRAFCKVCGSPLYYRSEAYPGETHFYAALLDDPEAVTPDKTYHADEALSWAPSLQV